MHAKSDNMNDNLAAAAATAAAAGPPSPASGCSLLVNIYGVLHRALHWAPFPAEASKEFFQTSPLARITLLAVSMFATAMVIGDGVLTPAISVVSAVSGLTFKTDISQEVIVGISVAIFVCLFVMQSFGTQRVSFIFSPVVVLWMR